MNEQADGLRKVAPVERPREPDDIANTIPFLAGSDGGWINAHTVRTNSVGSLRPHESEHGGWSCFQLSELLVELAEVLLAVCSKWASKYALSFATRPRARYGHRRARLSPSLI